VPTLGLLNESLKETIAKIKAHFKKKIYPRKKKSKKKIFLQKKIYLQNIRIRNRKVSTALPLLSLLELALRRNFAAFA
jgi:hypothetical protein